MEQPNRTKTNEPTNGNPAAPDVPGPEGAGGAEQTEDEAGARAAEVMAAYERAKQEMDAAVARLRAEITRLDVQQARRRAEGRT